jgi:hypothetical protein
MPRLRYAPVTTPTTADVAAILRARTKDLTGDEIGDFTANTRPTGTDVDRIIAMAYNEVTGISGVDLATRCAGLAFSLIVIRAAMWVEGSYWPEQVRSDRSIFTELAAQYAAGIPTLIECASGNLPAGDGTDDDASMGLRFGMIDVHGATSVPWPFGPPITYDYDDVPPPEGS